LDRGAELARYYYFIVGWRLELLGRQGRYILRLGWDLLSRREVIGDTRRHGGTGVTQHDAYVVV
jgi:hypothetical protein